MNIDPFYYHYVVGIPLHIFANVLILINLIKSHKSKYYLTLLIVFIMSCIFGMRGANVGLDTVNYYNFFKYEYDDISEIVFHLLRLVSFSNPDSGLVIVSLITNMLLLHAFKIYSVNYPILMAMIFSTFTFINININLIRQGLAIALFIFAVSLLVNSKRYFTFFLVFVVASATHVTSIIPFFAVLFTLLIRTKQLFSLIILISLAIASYLIDYGMLLSYISENFEVFYRLGAYYSWSQAKPWEFKHIYFLIVGLLILGMLLNYRLLVNNMKDKFILMPYSFLLVGFTVLFIFKDEEMVADRVFYYFLFFIPLILFDVVKKIISSVVINYLIIVLGVNVWIFKTLYIQYPGWFVPPYDSIRM